MSDVTFFETDNFEQDIRRNVPTKPRLTRCRVLCPACSRQLRAPKEHRKGDAYCSRCGQKIDWSDNDGSDRQYD